MTTTAVDLTAPLDGLLTAEAISPTHLDLPTGLTLDQYEAVGRWLAAVNRGTAWWVGDWLNYGERSVENYEQAVDATGMEPSTLTTWAWVASRVEPQRRRFGVPWSLHRMVAALPPREQNVWLKRCEKEGWKARDLKAALDEAEGAQQQIPVGDPAAADGGHGPNPRVVLDVAHAIARDARHDKASNGWWVPDETMARLLAALGQEER